MNAIIDLTRFQQDIAGEWWYLERDTSKTKGYKRRRCEWATCIDCQSEYLIASQYHRRRGVEGLRCSDCARRHTGQSVHPIGARRQTTDGYIQIKTDDGWIFEHRSVMAAALHRALQPDESVHHINGVRSDNRPSNLQLRRKAHGGGISLRCSCCGSTDIQPIGIGDLQEPLL